MYIQFTKFRIKLSHRTETLDKKSSRAGEKIQTRAGIIRLHFENPPFWRPAPELYPFRTGKDSESRPRKNRDRGAYHITASRPRPGMARNFAGHEKPRAIYGRVNIDHRRSRT
jgi:hypothetical protein